MENNATPSMYMPRQFVSDQLGDALTIMREHPLATLTSVDGERVVPLADYFTGYRTSVRRADELIRAVEAAAEDTLRLVPGSAGE